MLDGRALLRVQAAEGIGRGGRGGRNGKLGGGGWHGNSDKVTQLYIYPVFLPSKLCNSAANASRDDPGGVFQISTKTVNNCVEKHPLDMPQASKDAASNNLPIARARREPLKINGLRCQVAHKSNIYAI
jgi:hypothetical protein